MVPLRKQCKRKRFGEDGLRKVMQTYPGGCYRSDIAAILEASHTGYDSESLKNQMRHCDEKLWQCVGTQIRLPFLVGRKEFVLDLANPSLQLAYMVDSSVWLQDLFSWALARCPCANFICGSLCQSVSLSKRHAAV